jgi:hypothetical protein
MINFPIHFILEKIDRSFFRASFRGKLNLPNIVFLCGGDLNNKDYIARPALKDYIEANKSRSLVLYSENFAKTFPDLDLITIEKILASISDTIVIVLESVGSICELGLFTYLNKVAGKVVAVQNESYQSVKSFVSKGPLWKISKLSSARKRVIFLPFSGLHGGISFPSSLSEDDKKRILDSFPDPKVLSSSAFSIKNSSLEVNDIFWLMMAILEIIDDCWTLRFVDIEQCFLVIFDVTSISCSIDLQTPLLKSQTDTLVRFLVFFLEESGLVTEDSYHYLHVNSIKAANFSSSSAGKLTSVIFDSDFVNSYQFQKARMKRFSFLRRYGINVW